MNKDNLTTDDKLNIIKADINLIHIKFNILLIMAGICGGLLLLNFLVENEVMLLLKDLLRKF